MRQVLGKASAELSARDFAAVRARYAGVLLDVGAGDGKHVLAVARARPDLLVIGLDASPDGFGKAAARAAAKPERGGAPNAMFVWAAVEQLPAELAGVGEVHCLMPWGSLLRALVRPDGEVLASLAAACAPGAKLLITLNLHAWRPAVPEVGDAPEPTSETALATLAPAYAAAGWELTGADRPGAAELAALGTSWTKRLGSSRAELAVLALRGHRAEGQVGNWRQYS